MYETEILTFCSKLRFLKTKYGLTQKEMAEMCKISVSSMRKLLHNQLPPKLSVECVFNLAKALDIDIKDIFTPENL